MKSSQKNKIEHIISKVPNLTNGQLFWLHRVIDVFEEQHNFYLLQSDIFDKMALDNFGDALRIHHSFSREPFSKDKFEYVLERIINIGSATASLAPKGNPGYDIKINGTCIALKTQADKNLKEDKIWISKFMELGKGKWGNDPQDLNGLRNLFIAHMSKYERIFTLRTLSKGPNWKYEFVEIPKDLLMEAKYGQLEMKLKSRQTPKPGYCYVPQKAKPHKFQLYFDGGSERKLQIKHLLKQYCIVHATWDFTIPT